MLRFFLVSVSGGILLGVMDGLANANSLARRLYEVYKPIARTSVNFAAGIAVDLIYGFALAAIYLALFRSLPGGSGLVKGLSFGCLLWFLRVFMYTASQWMMFEIPMGTIAYMLMTGLIECLVVAILLGVTLKVAP